MTRPWTAPTTPTETVMGMIGSGSVTEMALIAKVMQNHDLSFEWAETAVKNAIVELVKGGRIEQTAPGIGAYRIAASVPMESKEPDAKRATTQRIAKPETGMQRLVREAQARDAMGRSK